MKEIILKLKVEDLLRKKTSKPSWLFLFREKNETLKIYLTHSSYSRTNKCEISSVDDITDHPMSEAAQAFIQESLKEVKFRNLLSICKFQCYFFPAGGWVFGSTDGDGFQPNVQTLSSLCENILNQS